MGGCCSSATPEANQTLNERRKNNTNPDNIEAMSDDEEEGVAAQNTGESDTTTDGKDTETVTLIDTEMKSEISDTDSTPQPNSRGRADSGEEDSKVSVSTPDPKRFVSLDSGGDTDDYLSDSDDGYSTAGEAEKGETKTRSQFYNLLDRHMTSKGTTEEEPKKKQIHPPLKDALLEIKINNIQLYTDPVASAGLRAKSNGAFVVDEDEQPDLPRKQSRSARKRSKTMDKKKDAMRRGVYIKADYHHSGVETGQTTDKHNSRPHDANMIDVFETMSFSLDTPPSAKPKSDTGDEKSEGTDKVDGRIEFRVKENKGSLYKAEKLGFASLKINDEISGGLIDRSGEWQTMNIPLFDMTDQEYKEARKKANRKRKKKKGKSTEGAKRLEVGLMRVNCRLFWTAEQISEFLKSMAESGDADVISYMSSITGDKYNLAQSTSARLSVTVLGMNLDSADASGWTAMTVRGLTAAMSMLAANDEDSEDDDSKQTPGDIPQMKDVFVECTYASEALPSSHVSLRTKKHSSKVDDVLFVGQELSFNVAPFKKDRIDGSIHGLSKFHKHNPYLQFFKYDRTKKICEEVPGTMLLQVRKVIGSTLKKKKKKKRDSDDDGSVDKEVKPTDIFQEIGCCLVHVDEMFADVNLEPGTTETNEFLFKEKLYETITKDDSSMASVLTRAGSTSESGSGSTAGLGSDERFEAKEVGYLFLKVRFDWSQ